MSYTALARKWRPKKFSELTGQEHVRRALVNALESGRVHHAFLFTGTRGVGKTTIARILAKCLNCETGVRAEPCGVCASCLEIDAGRFPDLIEVDAASRTKVDDTRELLDNVQYAPTRGRYKVYLVDEVHLVAAARRGVLHVVEELAGVVDLRARGRIDLDEVREASGVDLEAARTDAARLGPHTGLAVEAFGEDARDGGLADAARAGEEKRVMHAAALERVDERAAHVLLPRELGELLRSPFARQRGIAHERSISASAKEAARTSLGSGTRHRRCRCCLPALTGFTTGRRGETDAGHHDCLWLPPPANTMRDCLSPFGGEGGIRTHEHPLRCYWNSSHISTGVRGFESHPLRQMVINSRASCSRGAEAKGSHGGPHRFL